MTTTATDLSPRLAFTEIGGSRPRPKATKKANRLRRKADHLRAERRTDDLIGKIVDFIDERRLKCPRLKGRTSALPLVYSTLSPSWSSLPPSSYFFGSKKALGWNALSPKGKLFFACLKMTEERCLSFTAHLHSDFEDRLVGEGANVREVVLDRLRLALRKAGIADTLYFFNIEGASRQKGRVGLHLHGVVQAPTDAVWEAFKDALWFATYNHIEGKRTPNGVHITGTYGKDRWLGYIFKFANRRDKRLIGRTTSCPWHVTEAGRAFYKEFVERLPKVANDNVLCEKAMAA